MIKWTDEQLAAIEARDCDLLVAAAAGAGKTAVLVQRIINRIIHDDNPIDIDNMLVVTFTNAAAAEMRERIGEALDKAIEMEAQSQRLKRQILLLRKSSITTIHSFCMDILKNNYHCIDLDPEFRIADDTEGVLLKLEAIDDLFEEEYEKGNKGFIGLLDSYSGARDDEKLKNMVLEIYEYTQSTPWPNEWIDNMVSSYKTDKDFDFFNTEWAKLIMEYARVEIEASLKMLIRAEEIARNASGLEKCQEQLKEDIVYVRKFYEESQKSWDDLYKVFMGFSFERQKTARKGDQDAYNILKVLRKNAREKLSALGSDFFTSSSEDIKGDLSSLYPKIEYLGQLVKDFKRIYAEKKKEKGIIDFNDLEHFSLEILTQKDESGRINPSPIALSLRDRFDEILIDEYQDSNMVQEVILSIISRREEGRPNIFMVGDVKQSIYRFRQAKPELFLNKYHRYSESLEDKERKIKLFKNFRSRKAIIDGVNYFFKQIMTDYMGEIDYNEDEYLNYGALYEEEFENPEIELHLVDLGSNARLVEDEDEDEESYQEEPLEDIQAEARLVAMRIKKLVEGSLDEKPYRIYDKEQKQYRNIEYKDIVILLRTVKNWAESFEEELEYFGIPVFADTATGYFKRTEVQVMLSLLQIIDNPLQDIALISLMKSPIAGFDSEELLEIRLEKEDGYFYQALEAISLKGDKLGEKTRVFLERLDKWRDKALYMPTDQLIWYLLQDTGYMSYLGAMPQGRQRQANLRMLFQRAKQYEETSFRGLFNFINFIEKLRTSSGDMGNAKILGEKDNLVRIMSIHKSKGLEFPLVILAGVGKQFNLQYMNKDMLLHHELGFGIDLVDIDRRISYTTIPKIALRHKIKMETLSEEMRILYVALTRAKEKLIITGYDKKIESTLERWAGALHIKGEKLPPYMVLESKRYLDWIGLVLMRHKDFTQVREKMSGKNLSQDNILEDDSDFKLTLWNKNQLLGDPISQEAVSLDIEDLLKEIESKKDKIKLDEDLVKKLEWTYPYEDATRLPMKISVTELKRIKDQDLDDEYMESLFKTESMKKPSFMKEEKTISGAEKGSIIHHVMQKLDLKRISKIEDIEEEIENMLVKEFLTDEQAKAVDTSRIMQFLNSPLGKRLKNADRIYKEIPFNIEISAEEVFGDDKPMQEDIVAYASSSQDKILLQGIIDCYFIEGESIILVDYKTDYITGDSKQYALDRYKTQIDYYSKALEIALGKAVDEKYIYFFHTNSAIEM